MQIGLTRSFLGDPGQAAGVEASDGSVKIFQRDSRIPFGENVDA